MSCLEDEVENIPLWKCSNSGYCSNWKSKGPCSLLFCPYRLFKYMPQSLTLLVVVVTVTIKTNVHLVGKGGLKRHLPSRHLKRKFIKTTKPKTTELYCSIAHSTHNAFLTEKKKNLFPTAWCWALAWVFELWIHLHRETIPLPEELWLIVSALVKCAVQQEQDSRSGFSFMGFVSLVFFAFRLACSPDSQPSLCMCCRGLWRKTDPLTSAYLGCSFRKCQIVTCPLSQERC